MTDKEKLDKIYQYVKMREDFFYKPIEECKYTLGSMQYMQCLFQSSSFQETRYFIEDLMED
jgi:hypothetical protein